MRSKATPDYIYPKGHSKAGTTTYVLMKIWECPICGYKTNLRDDKVDHAIQHLTTGESHVR